MTDKNIPTPEELRKLLRYEPETGKLFWLPRPEDTFPDKRYALTWNKRYAGAEAFKTADGNGYLQGAVHGVVYKTHRVIWAIVTGEWPKDEIDHRNRNRSDNRWKNLREATRSENMQNAGVRSDNKSGYKGVCWDRNKMKWLAQITIGGDSRFLGLFETKELAADAYREASKAHFGEFARMR
jgi:hypothetical protein